MLQPKTAAKQGNCELPNITQGIILLIQHQRIRPLLNNLHRLSIYT